MKTLRQLYILLAFAIAFSTLNATNNPDWGATGHRTVGKIAEDYLTSKTKRKIADL